MLGTSHCCALGKAEGTARAVAWAASLVAHACAGVVCCFVARGTPSVHPAAEAPRPAELPVALVMVPDEPRPEVPAPPWEPEPTTPWPAAVGLPPIEAPAVPEPPPCRARVPAPVPPELPDQAMAWLGPVGPPPLADLGLRAPAPCEAAPVVAEEGAAGAAEPRPDEAVAAPTPPQPAAEELVRPVGAEPPAEAQSGIAAPAHPPVPCAGNRPPAYPRWARRRGYEGLVLLAARVSALGACLSVQVRESSGCTELDEAAAEAVRGWRFAPAISDGSPVESLVVIPIRFRLTD